MSVHFPPKRTFYIYMPFVQNVDFVFRNGLLTPRADVNLKTEFKLKIFA